MTDPNKRLFKRWDFAPERSRAGESLTHILMGTKCFWGVFILIENLS